MYRSFLACIAVTLTLSTPARAEDVTIFAAASLQTALDPVLATWAAETGNTTTVSYGGSGALAQQIINGAPAALFLSASDTWMEAVQAEGLLVESGRQEFWGNHLVLISGDPAAAPVVLESTLDLPGLLAGGKLAMGLVDSVPAGQYGKASLTSLGLWDAVSGDVAQVDNVRAALALVASGEAPLGIVYATDVLAEPRVHVIGTFPDDSHDPITYPIGLMANAPAAAAELATYLGSDSADAVFAAQGFVILN
jgi:molybdate transport system substrate-binding protein